MIWWLLDCASIAFVVLCIDRRADWAAFCLLAAAAIVGTAEVLSPWRLLAEPVAWLAVHGVIAAGLAGWKLRRLAGPEGARRPLRPIDAVANRLTHCRRRFRRLWGAGGLPFRVVAVGYGLLAVWAVAFPPSNWDSYNYHLTRVGFYLQQGSFERYEPLNPHEVEFPGNAETLALWTVAFLRHDRCVQLLQWAAVLAAAVSVARVATMLGASRRAARAGGLLALTLPEVVFQATSTQNDMCAAFCAIASLRFGLAAVRGGGRRDAIYAGLAAGLGFGTKGTYLFIGPGLAVYLLLEAWRAAGGFRVGNFGAAAKRLAPLAGCVIVGVAALGSRWFVDNAFAGDVGGAGTHEILTDPGEPLGGLSSSVRHSARIAFDMSGLPSIEPAKYVRLAVRPCMKAVSGLLRDARGMTEGGTWGLPVPYGMNEDTAYFGPLTLAWIVPGVVLAFRRAETRRAIVPAAVTAATMGWLVYYTPWSGRLFCVPLFLALPIVAAAWAGPSTRVPGSVRTAGYARFATALSLVVLVTCCLRHDGRRPEKWLGRDEASLRCAMRPALVPVCRWYLDSPAGGQVGFFGGGTDWSYMTFLPDFAASVATGPADADAVAERLLAGDLDRGTVRFPDGFATPLAVDGYRFARLTEDGWWGFERDKPSASPVATAATPARNPEAVLH